MQNSDTIIGVKKGACIMSYTKYGEFVRVLRIKHHEVMGDMAEILGASLPFISAVENGKKNVPSEWVDKLVEHYNLSSTERAELEDLKQRTFEKNRIKLYKQKLEQFEHVEKNDKYFHDLTCQKQEKHKNVQVCLSARAAPVYTDLSNQE